MNNVELARTSRLIALVSIASSALWVGSHFLDSHPTRGANAEGVPAPARSPDAVTSEEPCALAAAAPGVNPRVPWTGSKINGTPDPPPPYTVAPAFPHLKFESPSCAGPGQGHQPAVHRRIDGPRVLISERPRLQEGRPRARPCQAASRGYALYGISFHPHFEENRYVYVCYVLKNDLPDGSVVSRFVAEPDRSARDRPGQRAGDPQFWSGGHNGGCLEFGKDGYLYISTGDGAGPSPPDTLMTGQDCSDLLSSILRIDVDHPEAGKAYAIPPDNPLREACPASGPRSGRSVSATPGG